MSPENEFQKIKVKIDKDLQDIIPAYLENRESNVSQISQALIQKDYASIQSWGHQMKGSGSGYGFDQITEIGEQLEVAAKNRDDAAIEKQAQALRNYLEHLEITFE